MLKTPAIKPPFDDIEVWKKIYEKDDLSFDDFFEHHGEGFLETHHIHELSVESLFFFVPGPYYRSNKWSLRRQRSKARRHNKPDEVQIRFDTLMDRFPSHGIVDSIQQFKDRYTFLLARTHIPVCVIFSYGGIPSEMRAKAPNHKRFSYSGLGWRWHKQGQYMGTQGEPTCEYYADEEGFEQGVWFFSVERVL